MGSYSSGNNWLELSSRSTYGTYTHVVASSLQNPCCTPVRGLLPLLFISVVYLCAFRPMDLQMAANHNHLKTFRPLMHCQRFDHVDLKWVVLTMSQKILMCDHNWETLVQGDQTVSYWLFSREGPNEVVVGPCWFPLRKLQVSWFFQGKLI